MPGLLTSFSPPHHTLHQTTQAHCSKTTSQPRRTDPYDFTNFQT